MPDVRLSTVLIPLIVVGITDVGSAQRHNPLFERNLLTSRYDSVFVAATIVPGETWQHFPTIDDRDVWGSIGEKTRSALIEAAAAELDKPWPALPADLFLEFVRDGNRSNYQDPLFERRSRLSRFVLAELLEDRGRFLDEIVNGIWAISEESFWGVPAHLDLQEAGFGLPDVTEPVVDLFAAETGALLAWTHYLLSDRLDSVSPLVADRIEYEVKRRMLDPLLQRYDFWWMAFEPDVINNWNPWVNSNWLAAALLLEKDPVRRTSAVWKIMRSVDIFLNSYPPDGACDEGPGYWSRAGGSLLDVLELLHSSSNGMISIYDEPLVRKMGQYIYRTYIGGPYFINFADAQPEVTPDPATVFRYGQRIDDDQMMSFAALFARKTDLDSTVIGNRFGSLQRPVRTLLAMSELKSVDPAQPFERDVWFPDTEVMISRSNGSSAEGLILTAKAGHNEENHNHNDVGSFMVYSDGSPVLIDIGPATYTAVTFSEERYSLWYLQSDYHNVPTINGWMQSAGREFAGEVLSYAAGEDQTEISIDMTAAYPPDAEVEQWVRTATLDRHGAVEISDRFVLSTWRDTTGLNLMTARKVTALSPGLIRLRQSGSRDAFLHYDPSRLTPITKRIELEDPVLRRNWGDEIFRIRLVGRSGVTEATWTIHVDYEGG